MTQPLKDQKEREDFLFYIVQKMRYAQGACRAYDRSDYLRFLELAQLRLNELVNRENAENIIPHI